MYSVGQEDALHSFGVKVAFDMPEFKESLKQQLVGDPKETWKQFRKGTLLKPGKGLLYKGLPKTPGDIAASLAYPLLGSFLLAKNEPDKGPGEVTGDFLGRTVGSIVGAPLGGAVGQIGGGMLLAPVGQAIGKTLDRVRSPVVPEE